MQLLSIARSAFLGWCVCERCVIMLWHVHRAGSVWWFFCYLLASFFHGVSRRSNGLLLSAPCAFHSVAEWCGSSTVLAWSAVGDLIELFAPPGCISASLCNHCWLFLLKRIEDRESQQMKYQAPGQDALAQLNLQLLYQRTTNKVNQAIVSFMRTTSRTLIPGICRGKQLCKTRSDVLLSNPRRGARKTPWKMLFSKE